MCNFAQNGEFTPPPPFIARIAATLPTFGHVCQLSQLIFGVFWRLWAASGHLCPVLAALNHFRLLLEHVWMLLVVFLGHFEMFSILFGHFLYSLPTVGHLSYGPQCGGKRELHMQKYCCIFISLGLELLTGNTSTATLWCALTKKIGNC